MRRNRSWLAGRASTGWKNGVGEWRRVRVEARRDEEEEEGRAMQVRARHPSPKTLMGRGIGSRARGRVHKSRGLGEQNWRNWMFLSVRRWVVEGDENYYQVLPNCA
jgi:hypothetical protein